MEVIDQLRKAQQQANRSTSPHADTPTLQTGQAKAQGHIGDIFALPQDPSTWSPIQDLNPASPTFGQFTPPPTD